MFGKRFTFRAILLLTLILVVIIANSATACRMMGFVSSTSTPLGSNYLYTYDNVWKAWRQIAKKDSSMNPPYVWQRNCPNGWAGGPRQFLPFTYRSATDIATAFDSAMVDTVMNSVRVANRRVAYAHARRGSSGPANVPGPAPYEYNVMGNYFRFEHNGTIDTASMSAIRDRVGTGISATNIVNNREYTEWYNFSYPTGYNHARSHAIDSEYYGVNLIRNYLIARNYYNAVSTMHPTAASWALARTVSEIAPGITDNSLNALVQESDTLWGVRKVLGNPRFGEHAMSYKSYTINNIANAQAAVINMSVNEMQRRQHLNFVDSLYHQGFTNFPADSIGKFVGGYAPSFGRLQTAGFANPTELKVNNYTTSGSQEQSAIACNPLDGSFVVVWLSQTNYLRGRWYNPMGLAESGEFKINDPRPTTVCDAPDVAVNPVDGSIIVVWREHIDDTFFNVIKRSSLRWNPTYKTYELTENDVVVSAEFPDPSRRVLYKPSVAFSNDGGYCITWQADDQIRAVGRLPFEEFPPTIVSESNSMDPDVCFVEGEGFFAITFVSSRQDPPTIDVKLLRSHHFEVGNSNRITHLWNIHDFDVHPSICSGTHNQIGIAYNDGNVRVADNTILDINTINTDFFFTGERNRYYAYPQIAFSGTRYCVVYDQYGTSERDKNVVEVWSPVLGTALTTPVIVNSQPETYVQTSPVVAIAPNYPNPTRWQGWDHNYYTNFSQNDIFEIRRVITWQSDGQDGDRWAIVGKFAGLNTTNQVVSIYSIFTPDPFDLTPPFLAPIDTYINNDVADSKGDKGEDPKSIGRIESENPTDQAISTIPTKFALHAIAPNPFNASTTIRFAVPQTSRVQVTVFDAAGRQVSTLCDRDFDAGIHSIVWSGETNNLSAGIYFITMKSPNFITTRKAVYLK